MSANLQPPSLNILIGGKAGQGVATLGRILAKSLVRSGYQIVVTQGYQSRIRGGHNTFAIRVSQGSISAPQEAVDLLVALHADAVTADSRQSSVVSGGKAIFGQHTAAASQGESDELARMPSPPPSPAAAGEGEVCGPSPLSLKDEAKAGEGGCVYALSPESLVVVDEGFLIGDTVGNVLRVPYKQLTLGGAVNIAALGVVGRILGLDRELLAETVVDFFRKSHTSPRAAPGDEEACFRGRGDPSPSPCPLPPGEREYSGQGASLPPGESGVSDPSSNSRIQDVRSRDNTGTAEANRRVLLTAYDWSPETMVSLPELPHVYNPLKRMMVNGNEAIALGALSAGVKFYSFYPMTPSTGISTALAGHSKRMGLVVEQAEDEIAAINMAIGASFAGVPSMTATSGGGFALMGEGVSLAAMTETPIVIVVCQRPGPATGLPTRTEQADLELVLHAGHGEFPRAIFAPGTPEECFHLTRRAFELAERFQGPMFVLTDQFLADSYRAVEPFDVERLPPVHVANRAAPRSRVYRRYALTQDGISPRLLPGTPGSLVVADSDEHTEDGHLTEDLSVRKLMVEKRLRKGEGIRAAVIPPVYEGPNAPEVLLVSWGSTKGSAGEAALMLSEGGRRVATLHFSQVWPLVPEHFISHLRKAGKVVCVEGNATGQFANLIRRETGFEITERVLRYDGLPITPEYISRQSSVVSRQ